MADTRTALEVEGVDWLRVSPKYVAVELVSSLVTGLILCAASVPLVFAFLDGVWWTMAVAVVLVAIAIALVVLAPRRARSIGYLLRDDDLLFRRGIMFQRFVAVPYGRMQLIDINRGPLGRMLGLADLKFVTAAAATGVTLPGLPTAAADDLRDQLVRLAESRRSGL